MVWNHGQGLFGERYIIDKKLGEGGIGITYLARNQQGNQRVIKTLRAEILNHPKWIPYRKKLLQDFRDEALRLALCRHPHVVQIETLFDEGNLPCMAMEYIEGEDLGRRINRMGRLSESEALLYIRQIGSALSSIHSLGLLHRDIKPSNIMIRTGKSEAVLIDFGLAREFIPNAIQRHTDNRTEGFAPPEQYVPDAPRGEYIDVYALAATLYKSLTGKLPTSAPARLQNHPLEPPQWLNPNISDRVNEAIVRGMAIQSSDRPQSVQEWLNLLISDDGVGVEKTQPQESTKVDVDTNVGTKTTLTTLPPTTRVTTEPLLGKWRCVHTLMGHTEAVNSVAISPNGDIIASASSDSTIKLWDLKTGKEICTLVGHHWAVNAVAFSKDGQMLASGSADKTIKLWQVNTGVQINSLSGHSHWVNAIAWSQDGQILASASDDKTILLWEVSSGRKIRTISGHYWGVSDLAFSPDGQILAAASLEESIKLWWTSSGRKFSTLGSWFSKHTESVVCVAFSPDGQLLASGSADKTIKLWQVKRGKLIRTLTGHSELVMSVTFSTDGQILVSSSNDKTISLWQVSTGKEICTLTGHSNCVSSVACSTDGKTLVSGSNDYMVKIWQRS